MGYWRTLVMAGLYAVALGLVTDASAGEPTDQLRSQIEQLYQVVKGTAPESTKDREQTEILDRMFDWSRMAEAALRGHWQQRTPAERTEFTQLFASLFRRAYVSRVHVIDASKFQYLGDSIQGDRATVRTKVFTKKTTPIDVGYTVRLGEGRRWRIEDVRVEGISLIDNYRTQFDSLIARSSYAGLMEKLRGSVK